MRRISLFLFMLLLLLSVSISSAQQTPEATSPVAQVVAASLQVVDSSPALGEELAIDQPIKLVL